MRRYLFYECTPEGKHRYCTGGYKRGDEVAECTCTCHVANKTSGRKAMRRDQAERFLSMWTWVGYQGAEIQARGDKHMPYYVVCFPAGSKTGDKVMTIPEALDLAEKKYQEAALGTSSGSEEEGRSQESQPRRLKVNPGRRGHAESGQDEADERSHDED